MFDNIEPYDLPQYALKGQKHIAQGKRSGTLGILGTNLSRPERAKAL